MTSTEKTTYLYIALSMIVLLFMTGCSFNAKTTRPDGTETLASVYALEQATSDSQACLKDAQVMWNSHMTRQASLLPEGASEILVGMLLMNQAYLQRDALTNIIQTCTRNIALVAQTFNASDQQRMAAFRSIGLASVAGTFTYLSINSIANAFSQGMANAGGEYIVAGPGARIVNQQDKNYTYDDGFEIFGGNRTNDEGGTPIAGGQSPGAVSASGDGSVTGNTMNINFSSGESTGTAITDIPNFSPDPVVESPTEGLSSPVSSQPSIEAGGL